MKKSKLIRLLKSLTNEELSGFNKYIRSKFITQSKDVIKLFLLIRKYHPKFDSKSLNKHNAFKKLFSSQEYSDIKLRNLMKKLTYAVESFLMFQEYQKDTFFKRKVLMEIYRKRNLNWDLQKESHDFLTILRERTNPYSNYYFDLYLTQKNLFFHAAQLDQNANINILNESIKTLGYFFSLERLKLFYELLNRGKIFSERNEIDQNVSDLSGINPLNNQLYNLYKSLYTLIESPSIEGYLKTKNVFLKNIPLFTREDGQIIFFSVLNCAIKLRSLDEVRFLKESLELYKVGINKKMLVNGNIIPEITFFNIVVCGSKLREFNWTKEFINNFSTYLAIDIKDAITNISLSYWHFHNASFLPIIGLLEKFSHPNVLFEINARTLKLRAYYKLAEKDASYHNFVLSNIESYNKFIRRNKHITESRKKEYLGFSAILLKMLKILMNHTNKINPKMLLETVEKEKSIFAKTWLKEQIQQL